MYKKILVPLDGSPLSESVLHYAIDLAASVQAELVLLRVTPNPAAEFAFADPSIAERYVEDEENAALAYLKNVEANLDKKGVSHTSVAKEGAITGCILNTAQEQGVDLIAMATHGRTGMAHLFLGSVAEEVVRKSHIPVLLIRPKE